MTDKSDKIRSLVLAALMVFSVFAGTVAFAGTAAASDAVMFNTATPSSVNGGETVNNQQINFTVTNYTTDGNNDNVVVDLDDSLYTSLSVNSATTNSTNGIASSASASDQDGDGVNDRITFSVADQSGTISQSPISVGIDVSITYATVNSNQDLSTSVTFNDSDTGAISGTFNTVTVQETSAPSLRKATHYADSDSGTVLELAFSESISNPNGGSVVVGFEDGSTADLSSSALSVNGSASSGARVVVDTSQAFTNVRNVTVSGFQDSNGNAVSETTVDVTFAPVTVTPGSDMDAYVGSNVAFEATSTDTTINFDGPSYSPTRGTGTGSEVYVVNTSGFETGNYSADFQDDGNNVAYVELNSLGLTASAGNKTTEEDVTVTVEADDINRPVEVTLTNGSDFSTTQSAQIDSDGTVTVNFGSSLAAGDYTVNVEDVNTGVTASDSLTVSAAAQGSVSFGDTSNYETDLGDVAEITVTFSGGADTATLVVGNEQNSGYQANITVVDENGDGTATVQFNTYAAGSNSGTVSAMGDDTAMLRTPETNLGGSLLEDGGYDLTLILGNVSGATALDSTNAKFGSLFIDTRSSEQSMNLWTAPGSAGTNDDGSLDAELNTDDTIAAGDWVVHEVSAEGLEGLAAKQGGFGAALTSGLNVSVEQTGGVPPNTKPKTLDMSATPSSAITMWADADNDTYYIAIDTANAVFERPNQGGLSAKSGEAYTATFTIDDSKIVGDSPESANATFDVVSGSVSLDSTPVTVEAAENQSISGSSTYAAGTEITVTVRSTGDTSPRFYEQASTTVQADGTWSVEFDIFAEQSEGNTFSVNVNSGAATADGSVAAAATATPTPTATPTDTPTDTATPTETATPTATATATATATDAMTETQTDAMTETTTTETPGFGVVVALVALLAAALLAGRRE